MNLPANDPHEKSDSEAAEAAEAQPALKPTGGLSRVVQAGLSGETISAQGIFAAIGGVRGVVEAVLPAVVFLVTFIVTQNASVSAIAPLAVAILLVVARLVARQSFTAALSGLFGVLICVVSTLMSGRGEAYFLPGFFINAAWIIGLIVSLVIGWPLIGLLLGFLRGSLTEWRSNAVLRKAATICTYIWLGLFSARLLVQLPLYFAAEASQPGAFEALGIARIVMGMPLFGLAAVFTWLVLSKVGLEKESTQPE